MTSFFFSRGGGDVSHAGKFASTIARQLAEKSPAFKDLLCEVISNGTGITDRILKDQWKELLLKPLSKLEAGSFRAPLIIVIDALDECNEEGHIDQVLRLLAETQSLQRVRFRVLITSRPEIPIRHGLSQVADSDRQDFVLHDISRSVVDHDISLFLQHNLVTIRQKWDLAVGWPGKEIIRHLVRKAGGLFIWATTACRFIDEGEEYGPERLSDILEGDSSATKPEDELNKIYITVLEKSISPRLREQERTRSYTILRETLGIIVLLFSPLSAPSLAMLLHTSKEKFDAWLKHLHSILDIPKNPSRLVRLHHPSLRDFLLDPQKCRDAQFRVNEKITHGILANYCIQLMCENLKRDICDLHAPGAEAAKVSPDKIKQCLPAEVSTLASTGYSIFKRAKRSFLTMDKYIYSYRTICFTGLRL